MVFKVSSRPVIGITSPDKGFAIQCLFLCTHILWAGGWCVRISPSSPHNLTGLSGIVFSGGEDIAPEAYQETDEDIIQSIQDTSSGDSGRKSLLRGLISLCIYLLRRISGRKQRRSRVNEARDHLEMNLMKQAVARGMPVLGICRGMQLLNTVHGGTLFREIADIYEDVAPPYSVFPAKRIRVSEASRLHKILGISQMRVNALHHQSVKKIGGTLTVVARDDVDIVQALEKQNSHFAVGVQWHPEFMPQFPRQRRLFKAFVHAAHAYRKRMNRPPDACPDANDS